VEPAPDLERFDQGPTFSAILGKKAPHLTVSPYRNVGLWAVRPQRIGWTHFEKITLAVNVWSVVS